MGEVKRAAQDHRVGSGLLAHKAAGDRRRSVFDAAAVACVDGKRDKRPARMIEAHERRLQNRIQRLFGSEIGMRAPRHVAQ